MNFNDMCLFESDLFLFLRISNYNVVDEVAPNSYYNFDDPSFIISKEINLLLFYYII